MFDVITTFNGKIYGQTGRKCIETFEKHWPAECKMYAYYEDMPLSSEAWDIESERIKYMDFKIVCPEWNSFRKYAKTIEADKMRSVKKQSFRFEATRFAHKVYSLLHAVKNENKKVHKKRIFNNQYLVWLDADVFTDKNIPINFLKRMINPDRYMSYLGRERAHSECGFLIFNRYHPSHDSFWNDMEDMYTGHKLFQEREWHDSYIFDVVRQRHESKGMQDINISAIDPKSISETTSHVWMRSILAEYMDHMKGKSRKANGYSKERDYYKKKANL